MSSYTVVWEIDVEDADTMLAAAQYARDVLAAQTGNPPLDGAFQSAGEPVFTVTDTDTGESAQVDLACEIDCCTTCGRVTRVDDEPVDTDAADGWNGECGSCADRAETDGPS